MSLELEYDQSLLSKEHKAGPFEVTAELVSGLCATLGETGPLYTDEEAARNAGYETVLAPPIVCGLLIHQFQLPDIELKFGNTIYHAGQALEPLAAIQVGDQLTASSHLKEVYPKTGRTGTMVFIVWETVFSNQRGECVATVRNSTAARE